MEPNTVGDEPEAASSAAAVAPPKYNFLSITCVAWSASGRNVGLGTPDGLMIFSTERLLQYEREANAAAASSNPSATGISLEANRRDSSGGGGATQRLVEVCRRVIEGGVGLLSLYGQSSVVAVVGVRSPSQAMTVSLVDLSQPMQRTGPEGEGDTDEEDSELADGDAMAAMGQPSLSVLGAATTQFDSLTPFDLRPLTLAQARFPVSVAAVCCCPFFVVVGTSGDPRIAGSHKVYVFDLHLQQKYVFDAAPPRSNAFLQDCIAVATTWAPTVGAGVSVKRLRALLPGEKRGQVRLLTLKCTSVRRENSEITMEDGEVVPGSPPLASSSTAASSCGSSSSVGTFFTGELTVHQSVLRAVAITEDGRRGATIGESGTKIKLIELVDDNKLVDRATLERGRTTAIVDSVSLRVVTLPNTHRGRSADLVVCITSAGTIHLFLCDVLTGSLVYSREKILCPPKFTYPCAFAAVVPQPNTAATQCGLYIVQWSHEWANMRYLLKAGERSPEKGGSTTDSRAAATTTAGTASEVRLVTFHVSLSAKDTATGRPVVVCTPKLFVPFFSGVFAQGGMR